MPVVSSGLVHECCWLRLAAGACQLARESEECMIRIGNLVVDLKQCAVREFPESPCIEVYYQSHRFTFAEQFFPAEYAALKAYMARQERLLNDDEHRIACIVNNAFDPFIDTERLTAIYSLFSEIQTRENLLLCLESEEVGSIRLKGDLSVVVAWENAVEAVDRIHAYRQEVNALP